MTYTDYVNATANLMVLLETITNPASANPSTDANYNAILPRMIEYAENRIYRELDLMQTVSLPNAQLTSGTRGLTIPGSLIVINSANVITPAGTAPSLTAGVRNPMQRASMETINFTWPDPTVKAQPIYYSNITDSMIVLAPCPDQNYYVEFIGTVRPTPLSSSNPSTILTTYIPDVFLAASMVFASGYQLAFSRQSDDPQQSMSWEQQYQLLKASAEVEIFRSKAQSQAWQAFQPNSIATPPRAG